MIGHDSILSYAKSRYLWISVALTGASLVAYFLHDPGGPPNGEVFIADNCIGCGNCERNCPYGVIHMSYKPPKKPGLLQWLLFGRGSGPGEAPYDAHDHAAGEVKKAVKCDMCKGVDGGPACVRSCPTGAAIRISPEEFPSYAQSRR